MRFEAISEYITPYPNLAFRRENLGAEIKTKRRRRKGAYALTGFSCAIFQIKKNPRDSITVRTPSAKSPLGNGYAHG